MATKNYNFQPFVKLIIPFILGIIVQNVLHIPKIVSILLLSLFFVALFISVQINIYRQINVSGILVFLVFFTLGLFRLQPNTNNYNTLKNKQLFRAQLTEVPNDKGKNYAVNLHIKGIRTEKKWVSQNFNIIAYLQKGSSANTLKAGSEIVFYTDLRDIYDKKNPFDFDYKKYMQRKQINQTVYLKNKEWRLLNENYKGIKLLALNMRQELINTFVKSGVSDRQLGVLSALTLGYKNKLDSEIKRAYSGAGAMHVLAVSGMHVGIIFVVLNALFSLLLFFKKNSKIKYILIILCLWFYALLTGLSTSVLRASLMFSFVLLGYVLGRRIDVYNSLSASAMCLLLLNPNSLFEVSFQLSYIAVVGIVFFYPKIYKLFKIRNFVLNKMWELTAVSLAAQLATSPISLYYFNQFPTYFWLSNIVVSISATVLMFASILLIIAGPFAELQMFLGKIADYIVSMVNSFVMWINELPFAVISGISIYKIQVFIIYGIIISLAFWFINKNYRFLITSLFLIFIAISIRSYKTILVQKQTAICVYNIPNSSGIHFINRNKSFWIYQDADTIKSDFIYRANMFWNTNKTKQISKLNFVDNDLYVNKNFVKTELYNCFILDEKTILPNPKLFSDTVYLDFVLLRGKPYIKPNEFSKKLKYKTLVIDASVPFWIAKDWETDKTHNTKIEGAYILSALNR